MLSQDGQGVPGGPSLAGLRLQPGAAASPRSARPPSRRGRGGEPQTFCLHGDFPSPLGAAAAKPKSGLFGPEPPPR